MYPHDNELGVVAQQYAPDEVNGTDYYQPTAHGEEKALGDAA